MGKSWCATDGTLYGQTKDGYWIRLGYNDGFTTEHAIEFVKSLGE